MPLETPRTNWKEVMAPTPCSWPARVPPSGGTRSLDGSFQAFCNSRLVLRKVTPIQKQPSRSFDGDLGIQTLGLRTNSRRRSSNFSFISFIT
jgi:hypothetical protein